jgi:hydroxymethylbilane synthase
MSLISERIARVAQLHYLVRERIALGTRGSDLALTQARLVETALRKHWPGLQIDTKIITTSGDEGAAQPTERKISAGAGRKGLFTAEIERALTAGTIDVAVHSAKDLPSTLGGGTEVAAVLPRAPVEDVLVSLEGYELESLPCGAAVATGSVRRSYQVRWKRPDVRIVSLRGNVPTRLRKICNESWQAAILARAGLERLGLDVRNSPIFFENFQFGACILPSDVFVPAGGQGVIAMQVRAEDELTCKLLEPINHSNTCLCLRAEREFLRLLQADCNQPVGVLATGTDSTMKLRGQIFRPQEVSPKEAAVEGRSSDPEQLAAKLLQRLNGH